MQFAQATQNALPDVGHSIGTVDVGANQGEFVAPQ
jgi:hypothetical protein